MNPICYCVRLEYILYPTFSSEVRSLVLCDDTGDAAYCALLRQTQPRYRYVNWRQTRHLLKLRGLATRWSTTLTQQ